MSLNPLDDLSLFLQDVLPPVLGFASYDNFVRLQSNYHGPGTPITLPDVQHTSARKLREIQLARELMKRLPLDFCQKYIAGRQFTVKDLAPLECFSGLVSDKFSCTTPSDKAEAKRFEVAGGKDILEGLAPLLLSATEVMSIIWPKTTKDHSFVRVDDSHLEEPHQLLYGITAYQKKLEDGDQLEPTHKLMVFCIARWTFSCDLFSQFVYLGKNLPFRKRKPTAIFKYSYLHRVWAKIWDTCAQNRCPFFVMTDGFSWIFGVFLAGWTKATVSYVVGGRDKSPSVMQCLVYWLASAMGLKGGFKRPIDGFSAVAENLDIKHQRKLSEKAVPGPSEEFQVIENASKSVTIDHPSSPIAWITSFNGNA